MLLQFIDLPEELKAGVLRLQALLGYEASFEAADMRIPEIRIAVSSAARTGIVKQGSEAQIQYGTKNEFFRGLGLLIENQSQDRFALQPEPFLRTNGIMLDQSRGSVMHLKGIFEFLDYMALMGFNMLMLYTEDVYEIPEYSYFGYMRGRYSAEELRKCDDYAFDYGIEMIPCIQTYSHMEQYLRWEEAACVKDTNRVLLAGAEETYQLIDRMLNSLSSCFRSRRIHIGLDESQGMLRGKYMDRFGYEADTASVFRTHMERVHKIAKGYGLQPMMWSDMFFRLDSEDGDSYYTAKDIKAGIPSGMDLVYWNYDGNTDTDKKMLRIHKSTGSNVLFAGRIHTTGPLVNNVHAMSTIDNSFHALRSEQITEAFVTIWANDGGETDYRFCLPGLCCWAENAFSDKTPEREDVKKRFEFLTGADYAAFMKMSEFHNCFTDNRPRKDYLELTQGKRILYQDVMLGLMDHYLYQYPLASHYASCAETLAAYEKDESKWKNHYRFALVLFRLMAVKCRIAEGLKPAYDSGDREFLHRCTNEWLPYLEEQAQLFHELSRSQWFSVNKAQGFENLELRLSQLQARAYSARLRLEDYLNGGVERLEELEEERLPFSKFAYNCGEVFSVYKA